MRSARFKAGGYNPGSGRARNPGPAVDRFEHKSRVGKAYKDNLYELD